MKLILNENQYGKLKEMAYPSQFDVEHFKSLPNFRQRILYCKNNLEYIGGGSARMVFKIDNDKCLKLAKNKKGLAQNKSETDGYLVSSSATPGIYDYDDENYTWLEMQLASPASVRDFERFLGITFKQYCEYIKWFGISVIGQGYRNYAMDIDEELVEYCGENEFISEICDFMGSASMEYGDLIKKSSYGVLADGDLVLVDYGLTSDVWHTHYSRR